MLTSLLVRLKHSCPMLWRGVENVNSTLMRMRYDSLPQFAAREVEALNLRRTDGLAWSLVTPDDAPALSDFLCSLPTDRLVYFNPTPSMPPPSGAWPRDAPSSCSRSAIRTDG